MPIDYTPLVEGDALTAANINATFTALKAAVDELDQADLEEGALTDKHLPVSMSSFYFPNGMCKVDDTNSTKEEYSTGVASSSGTVWPLNLQDFSADAGALIAPFGPNTTPTNDTGWRIINPTAGDPLRVDCTNMRLRDTDTFTKLLVRGSVNYHEDPTTTTTYTPTGARGYRGAIFAIGWTDSLGNRHIIERSVRAFHPQSVHLGDTPVTALIGEDDLGGLFISNVFLAVASYQLDDDIVEATKYYPVWLNHGILTVLPLRAGAL